ncbi:hypothetical protein H9L39_19212 [Fusarium oxysporum f. sp. albedinis]|nr:hypothetical protein H9L39_19212 [Fusarium oxysporum f. sp. albedinis]
MPSFPQTTLASSTAPAALTHATVSSASQSQVPVDDFSVSARGNASVKRGPVLPLPPEYPDMFPSNSESENGDGPLSGFQRFIAHSGLVPLLSGPGSSGFNQHETLGITHGSAHSSCETQSGTQSNSTLPPDLHDAAMLSGTNVDDRVNKDPSDPAFQAYLIQNPHFVPPSAQTTVRYLKSFMRNGRFQVFPPRADINRLPIVARLAMLAIGAWHLFEAHSATLLFRASREIALKLWTSPQHDSTLFEQQNPVYLAIAFMLLLELVKLEQPVDIFQQLQILQSGLVCFLQPKPQDTEAGTTWCDWFEAETSRRTQAFGLLSVVSHQSICSPQSLVSLECLNLKFPCSETVWNSTIPDPIRQETGIGSAYSGTVAELIENLFSKTGSQQDIQLQSLPIQSLFIFAAGLLHRVTLLSQIPDSILSDDFIIVGYRRLVEVVTRCRQILATVESSTVLLKDTEAMLQLALTRAALHSGRNQIQTLYTPSPAKVPTLTRGGSATPQALTVSSWLSMTEMAHYLEEPANTGVTFFIRSQVSCWSFEKTMAVFESMIILASWISEMEVFNNVRTLLQLASSSMEKMDDQIMHLGPRKFAAALLNFWGYVFGDAQNKPLTKQLGKKLREYADAVK